MTKLAKACPILVLTLLQAGNGEPQIRFDAASVKVDQQGPGFVGMSGGPGSGSPGRVTWLLRCLRTRPDLTSKYIVNRSLSWLTNSVWRGGPRLKPSEKADADEMPPGPSKVGPDKFPVMPAGHGQRIALINGFHGKFQNYSMAEFAEHPGDFIESGDHKRRYVLARTGLKGV